MKNHFTWVDELLRNIEEHASNQLKVLEKTAQQHKTSYAEVVKGTCSEVAQVVKSQLADLPRASDKGERKAVVDLSRVLDDHLDKEKRNVKRMQLYLSP